MAQWVAVLATGMPKLTWIVVSCNPELFAPFTYSLSSVGCV